MKKLLALFCLFSLLTAFTCENEPLDDDTEIGSGNNNSDDVIGTWDLVEFDASVSSTTDFQGQVISSDVEILSTDVSYTLNFTESNYTTNGSYTYTANVVANGIEVPAEPYTLEDVMGNGSYSVSGNEMTVDGSFFEFTFEGMDFSDFQGEQTVSFQLSDDGQTLTFSQDETMTDTDALTGITTTSNTVSTSVWSRQ